MKNMKLSVRIERNTYMNKNINRNRTCNIIVAYSLFRIKPLLQDNTWDMFYLHGAKLLITSYQYHI